MSKSQSNQNMQNNDDDNDNEKKVPVDITLDSIIAQDCSKLTTMIGDLTQAEENQRGLKRIFHSSKCGFIATEYNYQVYRNLELSVGVELVQATSIIKQNVANDITLAASLAAALKNIVAAAKDAKKKFSDLRKAACDLNICLHDKCNCSQMLVLTGTPPQGCDDRGKRPEQPACPDAQEILDDLVEMPSIFLHDSDIILSAAADVSGIQTFTNIGSLDSLQQGLSTAVTAFDSLVQAKMMQGATDLTQSQKDLTAAINNLTQSEYALYNKRDEIDAENETIQYLCDHECICIREYTEDDEEDRGRLRDCKHEICEICTRIDDNFCRHEEHHEHEGHHEGRHEENREVQKYQGRQLR